MKKIIIVFCLIAVVGCKSKKSVVEKPVEVKSIAMPMSEVNSVQKQKAYDAGNRILMTCNTSKFKPFNSSEATESVIQNTTQDRLTKTCLKFRLKYGDFKELKLIEVIKEENSENTIYRYKAKYEKAIANKELRVTMNENDQVSAIKSLDWVDKF